MASINDPALDFDRPFLPDSIPKEQASVEFWYWAPPPSRYRATRTPSPCRTWHSSSCRCKAGRQPTCTRTQASCPRPLAKKMVPILHAAHTSSRCPRRSPPLRRAESGTCSPPRQSGTRSGTGMAQTPLPRLGPGLLFLCKRRSTTEWADSSCCRIFVVAACLPRSGSTRATPLTDCHKVTEECEERTNGRRFPRRCISVRV